MAPQCLVRHSLWILEANVNAIRFFSDKMSSSWSSIPQNVELCMTFTFSTSSFTNSFGANSKLTGADVRPHAHNRGSCWDHGGLAPGRKEFQMSGIRIPPFTVDPGSYNVLNGDVIFVEDVSQSSSFYCIFNMIHLKSKVISCKISKQENCLTEWLTTWWNIKKFIHLRTSSWFKNVHTCSYYIVSIWYLPQENVRFFLWTLTQTPPAAPVVESSAVLEALAGKGFGITNRDTRGFHGSKNITNPELPDDLHTRHIASIQRGMGDIFSHDMLNIFYNFLVIPQPFGKISSSPSPMGTNLANQRIWKMHALGAKGCEGAPVRPISMQEFFNIINTI